MLKFLLLLLLAVIAWAFFKKQQGAKRASTDQSAASEKAPSSADQSPKTSNERMVACGSCGVFMPESESVNSGGKISCRDPAHCAHRVS